MLYTCINMYHSDNRYLSLHCLKDWINGIDTIYLINCLSTSQNKIKNILINETVYFLHIDNNLQSYYEMCQLIKSSIINKIDQKKMDSIMYIDLKFELNSLIELKTIIHTINCTITHSLSYVNLSYYKNHHLWSFNPFIITYNLWLILHYQNFINFYSMNDKQLIDIESFFSKLIKKPIDPRRFKMNHRNIQKLDLNPIILSIVNYNHMDHDINQCYLYQNAYYYNQQPMNNDIFQLKVKNRIILINYDMSIFTVYNPRIVSGQQSVRTDNLEQPSEQIMNSIQNVNLEQESVQIDNQIVNPKLESVLIVFPEQIENQNVNLEQQPIRIEPISNPIMIKSIQNDELEPKLELIENSEQPLLPIKSIPNPVHDDLMRTFINQDNEMKTTNFTVIYLIDKNIYLTKTSRVRFHSIRALSEIVPVIYWGMNWNGYNDLMTIDENIQYNLTNKNILKGQIILLCYKPVSIKGFSTSKYLKCLSYNEMWDVPSTLKEINQAKPDLVICHHENDCINYQTIYYKQVHYKTKFIHIPHCAEKTIFKDLKLNKDIDILLCGSIGRHYPLRQRLKALIPKFPKSIKIHEHHHPGYINSDAFTDKYLIDFSQIINRSKICLTCTSNYKYRLGKMIEIPMCNSVLACDLPDQDQATFKEIMIEINNTMTDVEIINKLLHYLQHPKELALIRDKGHIWSQSYPQQRYAQTLKEELERLIQSESHIYVLSENLKSIPIKWICDVLKDEFRDYLNLKPDLKPDDQSIRFTDDINQADIIWILAPWCIRRYNTDQFRNKYVITTIHHIDPDKIKEIDEYFKTIDLITNKYHILCNTTYPELRKKTVKPIFTANFWINSLKFYHIPNKSVLMRKYGLPADGYIIGSFQKDSEGRNEKQPKLSKGPDLFIRILEDMKNHHKNLHILLSGWRRKYIINELLRLKIPYTYLEFVDSNTLNELYNCLDLYLVSSRIEGGPRSIMESAICKVPILSTRVGIADTILSPCSFYDKNDCMTYRDAIPDVQYAYEKIKNFEIQKYMDTFLNHLINNPGIL